MNKKFLLSLLGMICCIMSYAAATRPVAGKYYRIVNQSYSTVISESKFEKTLSCQEKGTNSDWKQIWTVVTSGTKTGIQNSMTKHYIQSQGSTSAQFQTGSALTAVTFEDTDDNHLLIKCGGYLHCDGSSNVVNWYDTSNEGDHWTFVEVSIDEAALATAQAEFAEAEAQADELKAIASKSATYAKLFTPFFEDNACTTLKSEYAQMSDDELKAAMAEAGLPVQLQTIGVKIKNQWSDEFNPEFSKTFRVQNYKCYTRAGEAKSYTRGTQINDMNNITGIWTNAVQLLYVFVDSDIPSGTSLRLAQTSGDLGRAWYDNGTTLKKGMNIIYCSTDLSNNWIMYAAPFSLKKPIADYPEIKIHIEGGEVIGYTDVTDLDEASANAQWKERVMHANNLMKSKGYTDLTTDRLNYIVRGKYGMMIFPLECYNQIWTNKSYNGQYTANYRIWKSMKFYDNVLMWEWGAMGITKRVLDGEAAPGLSRENMTGGDDIVPTYVNNHAAAMMMFNGGKNPYSSDSYTCMPGVGGVESSYNAERADFDTWCVGHESGHNNQGTINLESSMESSNNYFSNIITYLHGYRMSRGMNFDENYDQYTLTNTLFPHRSISMTLRMYYNLYLYYHRCQKKTDFSPTLFHLLREDPMQFSGGGWYEGPNGGANRGSANTTWIKFYKKVCEAAQEDLTEYFRMWGFFVPCKDAYCGDYTSYYVTLTQKEIDAAIAEVKSKGYPENKQICFVEDRLQAQVRFDNWANGTSKKPDNGGTVRDTKWLQDYHGNLGYCDDYLPENFKEGKYTYIASGTQVALEGEGGVGIIVYDKDGKIAYMANRLTFNIPASLASQEYTIKVINADGTEVVVEDALIAGTPEQKKQALLAAINSTNDIFALEDNTGKKVGFYTAEVLATLKDLVAQGQAAIKAGDVDNYVTIAKAISAELLSILNNEDAMQKIKSNAVYVLESKKNSGKLLTATSTGLKTGTSKTSKAAQWAFVPTTSEGVYYLQNYNTRNLITVTLSDGSVSGWACDATSLTNGYKTLVKSAGNGTFYLETSDEAKSINISGADGSIISWSPDEGSKWYITLVTEIDEYTKEDINELIASTNDLVNGVCTYTELDTKHTLQCTDETAADYISTNAPDPTDTTHGIDKLIDGKTTTYFESNHTNNSATKAYHYLLVDLGEGNAVDQVKFTMRSASGMHDVKPTTVKVMGSTDGTSFSTLKTLTDLPNANNKVTTYNSDVIKGANAYRFWRFQVNATNTENADKYPYFALAKFELSDHAVTIEKNAGYDALDNALITAAKEAGNTATNNLKGLITVLNNYDTYTTLLKAYNALLEAAKAIDPSAGIDDITIGSTENGAIYDLQGRRVYNPQPGNIYIINGRKIKK